jgi:tetratricopeptide (TPR) repeat protein
MQKSCPSCGAETFPGARFCRRCGATVHVPGVEGTGDVSPQAATVPLEGFEGRATDGLAPESGGRISSDTTRVSLAEMERLLRPQLDAVPQVPDPAATLITHSAATRPEAPAADYDEELTITVPRPSQTRETTADFDRATVPDALTDFEKTTDFEATHPADFDATRDFEATHPATHAQPRPATRDAAAFEDDSNGSVEEDSIGSIAPGHTQSHSEGAVTKSIGAKNASERMEAKAASERMGAQAVSDTTAAQAVSERRAADASAAGGPRVPGAEPRRTWPVVVAVCAAVLILAVAGAWLAFSLLRRPAVTDVPTQPPTAPATTDAAQQFDEKLTDAEALLAQGNMEGALARLREANALDPSNTRAHRRLGDLLLASGARREAIEEFRAVTRNAPDDFDAWHQLASAQLAEGLNRDAAESYRRFIELMGGESAVDPHDLLAYATALHHSGRVDEARALLQRLASGANPDVADSARRELGELAQTQPVPAPTQHAGEQRGEQSPREGEIASSTSPVTQTQPVPPTPTPAPPQPVPTPQPPTRPAEVSPAEHYSRGSGLWSSNRAAALEEFRAAASGGNLDAHYYLGLSYVEGKNLHALQRAEVVAALQHFQLAQRGRQYVAESRRYEQQLEKEFDRLRKR